MKKFLNDGNFPWMEKDPDAVLDYVADWANWLKGDTISTSSWTTENDGITIDSDSNTTTIATVWLSSGTEGTDYKVVNRIVTTAGRTKDQTLMMRIRSK